MIINAEITDSDSDQDDDDDVDNYMGYQALGQETCYGPSDSEDEDCEVNKLFVMFSLLPN